MQSLGFRLAAKTLQIQHEAHTARETAGQKDFEPRELRRYAGMISPSITTDGKCLRWQEACHGAPAPCSCMVAGYSATPHTQCSRSSMGKGSTPAAAPTPLPPRWFSWGLKACLYNVLGSTICWAEKGKAARTQSPATSNHSKLFLPLGSLPLKGFSLGDKVGTILATLL